LHTTQAYPFHSNSLNSRHHSLSHAMTISLEAQRRHILCRRSHLVTP
jgi:hypothetical protein